MVYNVYIVVILLHTKEEEEEEEVLSDQVISSCTMLTRGFRKNTREKDVCVRCGICVCSMLLYYYYY